jgi:CheY-like chemotaxis protein
VKVLVVDDDRTMRILFQQILTRLLSCDVIEAADGREGLGAIERHTPELVLLDTLMPVMDGTAMLEAARCNPLYANLPVVSVSSVTHAPTILRLMSLGILDYISKPLQWRDAKQRVETVIQSLNIGAVQQEGACFVLGAERETLLLVDKNPQFRGRARPVLERHFVVAELSSCAEGLDWVRGYHTDIVCVTDGQVLRDARMLAEAIRAMPPPRPAVYLLTDRPRMPEADRNRYDGVVAKSFVPDLFLRELRRMRASARAAVTLRERFAIEQNAEVATGPWQRRQ